MRYIEEVVSVQVSSIVRFDSYSCHWEGTSLEILKKGGLHYRSLFPFSLVHKTRGKSCRPEVGQAGTVGNHSHLTLRIQACENKSDQPCTQHLTSGNNHLPNKNFKTNGLPEVAAYFHHFLISTIRITTTCEERWDTIP